MIEFEAWPKTPRLRHDRKTLITEKIDGTNSAVIIRQFVVPEDGSEYGTHDPDGKRVMMDDSRYPLLNGRVGYLVGAQSRKRLITPGKNTDNAGFAGWVWDNAEKLVATLGPGRHFGEWWGQSIQRGYGMDHKIFSLFNAPRWAKAWEDDPMLEVRMNNLWMDVVPILHWGKFSDTAINESLQRLREFGSEAAARWGVFGQKAEGIVLRHLDLGGNLKVMLENDDIPKGAQK